jgi:hypothetical protein
VSHSSDYHLYQNSERGTKQKDKEGEKKRISGGWNQTRSVDQREESKRERNESNEENKENTPSDSPVVPLNRQNFSNSFLPKKNDFSSIWK